jgi:cleavage stimulation factor subunit 2
MVKMNAVNVDVLQVRPPSKLFDIQFGLDHSYSTLQKTVANFSAPPTAVAATPTAGVVTPIPAVQPHLAVPSQNSQYNTPAPQSQPPYPPANNNPTMNPYGNGLAAPALQHPVYSNHNYNSNDSPYSYTMPGPGIVGGIGGGGGGGGGISETLAAIPDDQKAMIMRVISMTPEQMALLPPQERASILQLVRTFDHYFNIYNDGISV